jgi:hypothetical protein
MPKDAVFLATIFAAAVGTLFMGFFANVPYALAPGMGLNAFFAYTVCSSFSLNFSWQEGLALVFICGIINILITVTKVRKIIIKSIPQTLQYAISGRENLRVYKDDVNHSEKGGCASENFGAKGGTILFELEILFHSFLPNFFCILYKNIENGREIHARFKRVNKNYTSSRTIYGGPVETLRPYYAEYIGVYIQFFLRIHMYNTIYHTKKQ